MPETTRAFAALEIPMESRLILGRYCAGLRERPGGGKIRWVRPEIIHMTVRFFGDLDRKQLKRAREAIRSLDGIWDRPVVAMGEIGAFPNRRRPQVVWLGIDDPGASVAALAEASDRAIRLHGFGAPDKPFVPHLTLGRLVRGAPPVDIDQLSAGLTPPRGELTIASITLFQSDLRPQGPVYTPLEIARPKGAVTGSESPKAAGP